MWETSAWGRKLLLMAASVAWYVLLAFAARAVDLNEPYLPLAICGGSVFYLRSQAKIREWLACLALSGSFALLVRFPAAKDWSVAASSVLALFGFGAFLMLGFQWIWSGTQWRQRTIAVLAPAAALVFFVFSAQHALNLGNLFHRTTYDLYLYAADGAFGFQPSFLCGRAMAASPTLRVVCLLAYLSLPLVMAFVVAFRVPIQAERASWDVISLLMLAGMGGWALYNVVPATGPIYAFAASFPHQSLPYAVLPKLLLEKIPVALSAPRNAIPSLHLTWVLLLYWNTKGMSRGMRLFLAIYLVLTAVSTLGTGEHYFLDLVAAVPYALTVQALVSPERQAAVSRRFLAASCGLGLTLGWLLLVRYGVKLMLLSPAVPWGLTALTCIIVWTVYAQIASLPTRPQADANQPQFGTTAGDGRRALGAHV